MTDKVSIDRFVAKVADGCYVVPSKPPQYNMRELIKYCRFKEIRASELNDDELKQFELKK